MSGAPIILTSGANLTGQRIRGVGCGQYNPYNPADNYLNAAAFSVPAEFTIPSTLVVPGVRTCGYANENLAISKVFPIGENVRLNFGGELFNIFNRHPWNGATGLDTSVTDPSFGEYTSAFDPRNVQFHLRVEF